MMKSKFRNIIVYCFFVSLVLMSCSDDGIVDPPDTSPPKVIDEMPDWSPDGNIIAYTHYPQNDNELQNGLQQIWLFDLNTMTKSFLTEGFNTAWSPDGSKIAFVKSGNIFVIDLGTKEITKLTNWSSCFFPSWSPDGRKIAFDTNHNDPKGANAVWIMDADGTNKKDISIHGTGEWREPAWSRDGKWILHVRYIVGIVFTEVFLMDTVGNNAIRLTNNTSPDEDPAWSYDGKQIAWGSGDKDNIGIWIMNSDDTNKHLLIRNGGYPTWSPDNKKIAFHKVDDSGKNIVLWIINVDGTNLTQLTRP